MCNLKYIRDYVAFNEDPTIKKQKHEDVYDGSAPDSK
jgi:hypothetical protein